MRERVHGRPPPPRVPKPIRVHVQGQQRRHRQVAGGRARAGVGRWRGGEPMKGAFRHGRQAQRLGSRVGSCAQHRGERRGDPFVRDVGKRAPLAPADCGEGRARGGQCCGTRAAEVPLRRAGARRSRSAAREDRCAIRHRWKRCAVVRVPRGAGAATQTRKRCAAGAMAGSARRGNASCQMGIRHREVAASGAGTVTSRCFRRRRAPVCARTASRCPRSSVAAAAAVATLNRILSAASCAHERRGGLRQPGESGTAAAK